jgi:hypothetical protein
VKAGTFAVGHFAVSVSAAGFEGNFVRAAVEIETPPAKEPVKSYPGLSATWVVAVVFAAAVAAVGGTVVPELEIEKIQRSIAGEAVQRIAAKVAAAE